MFKGANIMGKIERNQNVKEHLGFIMNMLFINMKKESIHDYRAYFVSIFY